MIKAEINSDPELNCMKILVLEKNGPQLARMVNQFDPHTPDFCGRKECFPCCTAERPTRGNCWTLGAAYRLECLDCKTRGIRAIYHGESGHSSHYRYWGRFHWDGLVKGKPDVCFGLPQLNLPSW